MSLHDLNRSNDTAIATLQVASITPKDWPTLPARAPDATPAYVPGVTYFGGAPNTAPFTPVEHGTANATNEYEPRTQADKVIALGVGNADPINTPFGLIAPQDPYPTAATPAPDDPTLTALTPNTAVTGQPSIIVIATGTGFTPYSVVEVGGTHYAPTTYVSPTELRFPVDTMNSVAGVIDVKVLEHNLKTDAVPFTFT